MDYQGPRRFLLVVYEYRFNQNGSIFADNRKFVNILRQYGTYLLTQNILYLDFFNTPGSIMETFH